MMCNSENPSTELDSFQSINVISTVTRNKKVVTTTVCKRDQSNCFTFTKEENFMSGEVENILAEMNILQTQENN